MAGFKDLIEKFQAQLKYKDLHPEALNTSQPVEADLIAEEDEKIMKDSVNPGSTDLIKKELEEPTEEQKDYLQRLRKYMAERKEYRNGK